MASNNFYKTFISLKSFFFDSKWNFAFVKCNERKSLVIITLAIASLETRQGGYGKDCPKGRNSRPDSVTLLKINFNKICRNIKEFMKKVLVCVK